MENIEDKLPKFVLELNEITAKVKKIVKVFQKSVRKFLTFRVKSMHPKLA